MIRCETFEKNNDGFMQAEVNNLIEHRSKICTSSVYDCRFLIDKGGTTVYWNNQPSPQIRLNEQSIQSINAYYQNFHEMLDECSVRSANGDKVFNYLFINASVLFVATSITGVKLTQKLMKLFKNHPSTELN
jgi:hypothetical protein